MAYCGPEQEYFLVDSHFFLARPDLPIDKILLSHRARGPEVERIEALARARNLDLRRVTPAEVTRLSRNRAQDQGVVADVRAPAMDDLDDAVSAGTVPDHLLVLDGLTTPANVGLILRTAAAAGFATVLPRAGSPEVGPRVIKASAGVAFTARILRTPHVAAALDLLRDHGTACIGLDGLAPHSLYRVALPRRVAFVLGSESRGLSEAARARLDGAVRLPLAPGVESLNVAVAAAVAVFEVRRRLTAAPESPAAPP